MAEVKIRVGASVDSSLRTAFRPLVQSAIEARRLIAREFAQLPKEIAAGATSGTKASVAASREAAREKVRVEREAAREIASLGQFVRADARRAQREMLSEHARNLRAMRAAEREVSRQRRMDARELDRFATRTSHRATRFLTPNIPIASIAGRAFHGAMAGFGIDTTFAGAARRNIALESAAIGVTNQARLNGQNITPSSVVGTVRAVQKKFGTGSEETVGALEQFQKVTGDLKLGMDLLDALALRSATTGVKMDALAAAAANVSTNLGDVPNKGEKVLSVLDRFTVQGATGAIEISDMATQAAKFAALAPLFAGDSAENMGLLAAMGQVSRSKGGGSATPQQAATAVASFTNTFSKGARLKALRAAGIEAIDPTTKQIMNPRELIKKILTASGGDPEKMNAMVMDAQAKRAMRGFSTAFNTAGGGQKGLDAVDALFAKFMKGAISPETRKENLAAANDSTARKVEKFQAALDEVAGQLQAQLLPVLVEAQPSIIKFVKAMGDLAAWAVQNPGKAILAAILLSIARAGIESALRGAIERVLVNGLAGGSVGVGGKGGTGNPGLAVSRLQGAQNLMGAAAFAALGIGAFADQAGDLQKVTGSKSSLADILPGMKNGSFSFSQFGNDIFGDAKAMIGLAKDPANAGKTLAGSGTGRRFAAFGNAVSGIFNMDENLNSQARERFEKEQAEKAKREAEAKKIATSSGHAQGNVGETVEQFMERFQAEFSQKKEERALIDAQLKTAEVLAGGKLKVQVTNFPKEGEGGGEDPNAPPAST